MERDAWIKEFIRLLQERIPEFGDEQALQLAEGCIENGDLETSPEDALADEMDSWTDDGDEC